MNTTNIKQLLNTVATEVLPTSCPSQTVGALPFNLVWSSLTAQSPPPYSPEDFYFAFKARVLFVDLLNSDQLVLGLQLVNSYPVS